MLSIIISGDFFFCATTSDAHWGFCLGWWLLAFIIGGIPFGYLAGKMNGIDVRQAGSGNIGATNVFRTVGKPWGIAVFILDFLKSYIPLIILKPLLLNTASSDLPIPSDAILLVAGVLSVLGHNYSPFLGFKGGKGMATSAGFLLALVPMGFLVCLGGWIVIFFTTRYVSLASIVASALLPIAGFIFYRDQIWILGASILLGLMGVWRHRTNIRRLLDGSEHRFSRATKSSAPSASPPAEPK